MKKKQPRPIKNQFTKEDENNMYDIFLIESRRESVGLIDGDCDESESGVYKRLKHTDDEELLESFFDFDLPYKDKGEEQAKAKNESKMAEDEQYELGRNPLLANSAVNDYFFSHSSLASQLDVHEEIKTLEDLETVINEISERQIKKPTPHRLRSPIQHTFKNNDKALDIDFAASEDKKISFKKKKRVVSIPLKNKQDLVTYSPITENEMLKSQLQQLKTELLGLNKYHTHVKDEILSFNIKNEKLINQIASMYSSRNNIKNSMNQLDKPDNSFIGDKSFLGRPEKSFFKEMERNLALLDNKRKSSGNRNGFVDKRSSAKELGKKETINNIKTLNVNKKRKNLVSPKVISKTKQVSPIARNKTQNQKDFDLRQLAKESTAIPGQEDREINYNKTKESLNNFLKKTKKRRTKTDKKNR